MATILSGDKQQNNMPTKIEPTCHEQRLLIDLYEEASVDPVYQAKARILNQAIQEIGMGRYQVGSRRSHFYVNTYVLNSFPVVSVHRRWLWLVRVSVFDFPIKNSI
jgi:hypothetical protein